MQIYFHIVYSLTYSIIGKGGIIILKLELLQKLLVIAITLSVITCAFIQKTKKCFKGSDFLCLYSLFINVGIGVVFCITFTTVNFPMSLWVGLFSFLGADTIYKTLEGKLASYKDLVTKDDISDPDETLIKTEENQEEESTEIQTEKQTEPSMEKQIEPLIETQIEPSMEKPLFPSKYMRITQSYGTGTHRDSFAIDNAGSDQGIDDIYAPFTGTIKKVYATAANEVWLESNNPVEYPDGTIDYMTILFAHDNDISDLYVGKIINRGEVFYQEGTAGDATGNHCHIECAKGKFVGSGWYQNAAGYWSINNGKKPEECLWIDDSIVIIDSKGLIFRKIPSTPPTPSELKYKIGDRVIINGQLFGDSDGNNPGRVVSNVTTTITRVKPGKPYPYNTEGDLGWISETSITKVSEPTPNPTPSELKYKIGDRVIINGQLFGDSDGNNPGRIVSNVTTTITRVKPGKPYPYNTEGDLGWISETSITKVSEPTPSELKYKIGDRVIINGQLFGDSDGNNPGRIVSNVTTTITRVKLGKPYPYNTEGDLGWMSEANITKIVNSEAALTLEPISEENAALVFTSPKTDIYAIELETGQKLYLK